MSELSYNQERLMFLIEMISNWEVYLTDKQLEATKLYLSTFDATMVDIKLDLTKSTAHKRIFGGSTSKGALGRLEEAYTKLEKMGYLKNDKNNKSAKTNKRNITQPILANKTLEKTKELFLIISQLENYNSYLTQSQNEKLDKFLSTRSFKACAKYFNINESSFKQSILGRDDSSGILGKLKKEYDKNHINDWDNIN